MSYIKIRRSDIVRYLSVSLSLTLNKTDEKVEQHIRKKIYKSNVLRFWIKSDIIFLYIGLLLSFL